MQVLHVKPLLGTKYSIRTMFVRVSKRKRSRLLTSHFQRGKRLRKLRLRNNWHPHRDKRKNLKQKSKPGGNGNPGNLFQTTTLTGQMRNGSKLKTSLTHSLTNKFL